MNQCLRATLAAAVIIVLPELVSAQGAAGEIHSLQSVLTKLYDDTLPLCSQLTGVGRSIAGFAATWYIASRVWRSIAAAEPIDFYPLFRPFALGLSIMLFPYVIAIMNHVLQPTVNGTALLLDGSNKAVADLLKQKEEEIKKTTKYQMLMGEDGNGNRDLWMQYYHKEEIGKEGIFGKLGNDVSFTMSKMNYAFRNSIKQALATILQILFEAAALCINTLRTFKLLILAIIGPLVFGIAVFDGFQHILQVWLARYINIFLWLPIANILGALLGKIEEGMLRLDLSQIQQTGDTFFSSYDLGYIIFLIIGIICFFTVPSIADEVLFVGGGGGMQSGVTRLFTRTTSAVTYAATGTTAGMVGDMRGDLNNMMSGGMAASNSGNYYADNNAHQRDKISG